ncbi:phage Gp37/Gp68 family protein [Azospirillum doebereinerae]|uniref:DUF5131 family protein n=1 Tax=Azospirillum doebereinerae TaxID=92933 RepID=UPI001EE57343|nr:DUF5131 family protein [Azospirillum doebereinerae]MCG5238403.1 phage Gp37/Gp68 family protein [Azospirillum doebereinerae]
MTVLKTHISWCDGTHNPATRCEEVTEECWNCYARHGVARGMQGPQPWGEPVLHPERLAHVSRFAPIREADGVRPFLVFANSTSDLFWDKIPDAFRDRVFDAYEAQPDAVFLILTKRPLALERYVSARYRGRGIPAHLWFGASAGINKAARRLDVLRRIKDNVGPFTALVSVEPLLERPDRLDFTGLDWVFVGGESPQSHSARPMEEDWARLALDRAGEAGAARWFKQWGVWSNNPLYRAAPDRLHIDRVRGAIARGELAAEIVPHPVTGKLQVKGEKGGATLDGRMIRERPAAYHALTQALRTRRGAPALLPLGA